MTDKLRSYGAALRKLALEVDHRAHKGINNRIEEIAQTNTETRKNTGPFQVSPSGAEILGRP